MALPCHESRKKRNLYLLSNPRLPQSYRSPVAEVPVNVQPIRSIAFDPEPNDRLDEFDVCRNILESILTGVCVVDIQKKILRITGHLRHEVIGRSCIAKALLHCEQSVCEFCRRLPSGSCYQNSPVSGILRIPSSQIPDT